MSTPATQTDRRCGTPAGYFAHRRRDEKACGPCRRAHQARYGAANAARARALTRLARLYPEEFRRLFAEERRAER